MPTKRQFLTAIGQVLGARDGAFGERPASEKLTTDGSRASFSTAGLVSTAHAQPTQPAKSKLKLGMYVGNGGDTAGTGVADLVARHTKVALLGRTPDYLLAFTGEGDRNEYRSSVAWQRGNSYGKGTKSVIWSVPLLYGDRSLSEARDGLLDDDYTAAATALADVPLDDEHQIKIRTGWEFNGDWFKWKTRWWANDREFAGAFRQMVKCFKAVNPNFAFIWNCNIEQKDPEPAYPGDDAVDFVTMDFYVQQSYDEVSGATPTSAGDWFDFMVDRPNGLANLVAMGKKYGKPIGIDEWGVSDDVMNGVDMAEYVSLAFDFFVRNGFHHALWWDGESGYESEISGGKQPQILRAYSGAVARL